MKQKAVIAIMVVIAVLLSISISLITHHASRITQGSAVHARYYCPMHPTMTSERPGECPICSMKLVKMEAPAAIPRDAHQHASEQFTSICYLHNCPKLHEGQPCPMTVVAKPGEQVICPICGSHVAEAATATQAKKILYWTDPMIPGYKTQGPGKSPMGMDLVPVYEETPGARAVSSSNAPAGYAPVLVTPQKQQLIGIKTSPVQRRTLTKTVRTAGVVAHDPELYQAQQEFIQADQAWQNAQRGGSAEAAALAQELVDSSRLRLRHLGLNDELINEMSTWTEPDHRLLVGGAGQCWVYASIYEYELPLVRPGQHVTVAVSALTGQRFDGVVKAIDPMLDPMTRTARARILIDNPQGILKPDMYVNVSIVAELGEVTAVPEEAVFITGERQIVFVDQGQGLFEPRAVTLGMRADGSYEVKDGVAVGDSVVTSGNFLIDSESRLKGALQQVESPQQTRGSTSSSLDSAAPRSGRPPEQGPTAKAGARVEGVGDETHHHGQ